jgi:uncharacterized protein YecE (DUF72 family)
VKPQRPKVEPIREPTLFQLEKAFEAASMLKAERPFSLPGTGIYLGTSAFTAAGWEGSFYPRGTKPADYLKFYASQFQTVEVDSTFYRTPSASTVTGWYEKTPPDFIFAAKVPRVITHDKVLVDCEAEFDEFISRMDLLDEKLGPLLLQFPYFNKQAFKSVGEFLSRLRFFLKRVQPMFTCRFAIEIRNKHWLDARFADLLREYNVALALTDQGWMPRPEELFERFDPITADFAYVRWLGDRKAIEELTTTWDKVILDRTPEMRNWVEVSRTMVHNTKILKIFAFANNHYAGHAPATVKLFWDTWNEKQ